MTLPIFTWTFHYYKILLALIQSVPDLAVAHQHAPYLHALELKVLLGLRQLTNQPMLLKDPILISMPCRNWRNGNHLPSKMTIMRIRLL